MRRYRAILNPPIETFTDYEVETIAMVRRELTDTDIDRLSDAEIARLWEYYSTELYCAGWLMCNIAGIREFYKWTMEEV